MLKISSVIIQLFLGAGGTFFMLTGQHDKAAAALSMAAFMGVTLLQLELLASK